MKYKDQMTGHGKLFREVDTEFLRKYQDSLRHGKCREKSPKWTPGWNVCYEGSFVSDKFSGQGIFTWSDGYQYKGEFDNGLRHGLGIEYEADGSVVYKGLYSEGKACNPGAPSRPDGDLPHILFAPRKIEKGPVSLAADDPKYLEVPIQGVKPQKPSKRIQNIAFSAITPLQATPL